ncbi:TRAP transporter small permease [Cetobacterium somerae]|uniref:TRAP transporter small permease n=1 Tax=Cetobacterium somerae TaxID=188913 RepID=UPI003D7683E0
MDKLRESINKFIFIISASLLIIMVATVAWQVASRYVFNSPSIFTDELARFLLMWIGMLGTTYAFGSKSHLSMDYLHTFLKVDTVKVIKIILPILSIVFMGFVMVWGGTLLTLNTMKQLSPVLYIPMGVVYSILPITGVINIFYFITYIGDELALKGSDR